MMRQIIKLSRQPVIAACVCLVVFTLLFSVLFIGHGLEHHCDHAADCPVCVCIAQCRELLRKLESAYAGMYALVLVSLLLCRSILSGRVLTVVRSTPVSCRVRLNC